MRTPKPAPLFALLDTGTCDLHGEIADVAQHATGNPQAAVRLARLVEASSVLTDVDMLALEADPAFAHACSNHLAASVLDMILDRVKDREPAPVLSDLIAEPDEPAVVDEPPAPSKKARQTEDAS